MKNPLDRNPFSYNPYFRFSSLSHHDETDDQFSDRRKIRKNLLSHFLNGNSNVVLYGPRGYGKSSLAVELVADLKKAGVKCMLFDVVKTPSIDLFVSSYVTNVYYHIEPDNFEFKQMETFLKSLKPKKIIHWLGASRLFYNSSNAPISALALAEVLDIPRKLLFGKGRFVVIFDEFQEVTNLLPNDMFERVMKPIIQSHRDNNVSYLFLGSHYHILRMFTAPNSPIYNLATPILLEKPPEDESIRFVIDRFARARKIIDRKHAEHLVARARNIPCFIQQLGFETFRLANDARLKYVSDLKVDEAFFNIIRFNRNKYEQMMLTLSDSQKKVLIALAYEPTNAFNEAYRWRYSLGALSSVYSTKTKLIENGLIEFSDGYYGVFDPFFEWFLRQE